MSLYWNLFVLSGTAVFYDLGLCLGHLLQVHIFFLTWLFLLFLMDPWKSSIRFYAIVSLLWFFSNISLSGGDAYYVKWKTSCHLHVIVCLHPGVTTGLPVFQSNSSSLIVVGILVACEFSTSLLYTTNTVKLRNNSFLWKL